MNEPFEASPPMWRYRVASVMRCTGPMFCPGDHNRFNSPDLFRPYRSERFRPQKFATQRWEYGQRWLRSDHWQMKEQDARIMARRAERGTHVD